MKINSPEELDQLGLTPYEDSSLLQDDRYKSVESYLLNLIQTTPELSKRPPRPYQLRYACLGVLRENNLYAHTQGTGKCVAKGTQLLMFDGSIKLVEDIRVGDKLMGPDSKSRKVLSLARGREMMYRVTPTKGDPYVVNESHILSLKASGAIATYRTQGWAGYNTRPANSRSYKHGEIVNISVKEYLKQNANFKARALGYRVGVNFPAKKTLLDPYILGVWLGDGTSSAPWVTTMDSSIVDSLDTFATSIGLTLKKGPLKKPNDKARNYYITGKRGKKGSNPFTNALRTLGIFNNKRIPREYLINDRETRLAVLAGLLDTDGYLSNNCYEISSSRDELAEDILFLARSLGFAAYNHKRMKKCCNPGYEKETLVNVISISGDTDKIPVRIGYKKASSRKQRKNALVTGIKVEAVGEDDYYGFTISGDHLFLLGDFTVTHNTYVASLMIHAIYKNNLSKLRPGTIHILAPKHTLKLVWLKKELALTGLAKYAEVIDSERTARLSKMPIWIYHYDLLKRESKETSKPLYKLFKKRFAPNLLIIDECHRNRLGSFRSAAVRELRKKAKRVLGLTGTPMDGWVEHLSSILAIIYRQNTNEFPYTAGSFTRKYTRVELQSRDYVTAAENGKSVKRRPSPGVAKDQLPSFYQATKHLIHRLTFQDPEVSPHVKFPKTDHQVLKLEADVSHRDFYNDLHQKIMTLIASAINELDTGTSSRMKVRQNVLTHLNALRAAANHPWEMKDVKSFSRTNTAKIDKIVELVKLYKQQNRKVIVFTNRIAVGREITKTLKSNNLNIIRIYDQDVGASPKKLSQDDRDKRIEQFQEDPNIDCLVGNLDLMSEGLTLVEASVVIHHDHDWKSTAWSQGNNRVVRPGQDYDPVPVYDLVIANSVDDYIYQAMRRKAIATLQTIDKNFDTMEAAMIDPIDVARSMMTNERDNNGRSNPPTSS